MNEPALETASLPSRMARRDQLLLFAATLNAAVGTSLLLTVIPPISRELGWSESRSGLLISASGLAFLLAAPLWGRAGDHRHRGRLVAIGLTGYAVSFAVFAFLAGLGLAGTVGGFGLYLVLLLSRPVGGALAAAVPTAAQAWISDHTTDKQRTGGLAVLQAANGLGLVVGPALGAALVTLGLLAPLWFAAGAALLTAVLVLLLLPDQRQTSAVDAVPPRRRLLSPLDHRYRSYLAVLLIVFLASAVVASTTGFLLQDRLGLDATQTASGTGLCLLLVGLGLAGVQGVVRALSLTPRAMLRTGPLLMLAGFGVLVLAEALPVFLLAHALLGAGAGLAGPGATAAATLQVHRHEQGSLAGLTTAMTAAGFAVGPLVAGAMYQTAQWLPYATMSAALLPVAVLAQTRRGRDAEPAAASPRSDVRDDGSGTPT